MLQARVPVEADDDEQTLAARVLTQEHVIYPQVVRWFAEGRLTMNSSQLLMDGKLIDGPVIIDYQQDPSKL